MLGQATCPGRARQVCGNNKNRIKDKTARSIKRAIIDARTGAAAVAVAAACDGVGSGVACNKLNRIWCETKKPKKKGEKMRQKRETRDPCVCVCLENCERETRNEKNVSQAGARSAATATVTLQRYQGSEGDGDTLDVGEWKVKNLKGHKLINH